MKKELAELAIHRLRRAKTTFDEGLTLLEKDALSGALNRFYYAAFYAARSLLATKELDSAKHSGVISLFHQHFVKTNLIDAETAKALSRSFEKRQDSDYEDFVQPTREDLLSVRNQVQQLIAACEEILSNFGMREPK